MPSTRWIQLLCRSRALLDPRFATNVSELDWVIPCKQNAVLYLLYKVYKRKPNFGIVIVTDFN
jgi:hypothetical protein